MVELTASGDADEVEARLGEALDAHGLQLFARIDHSAGARKADVELEADVLLIFGNPRRGSYAPMSSRAPPELVPSTPVVKCCRPQWRCRSTTRALGASPTLAARIPPG